MAKTTYLVLTETGEDQWAVVAQVDATDYRSAIQAGAESEGVFVALPLLTWRPKQVAREVTQQFRLDDVPKKKEATQA